MDTINNIFSKGKLINGSGNIQKVKYNRVQLLNKETAQRLNTYLNFGIFPTYADTYNEFEPKKGPGTPGVRSLFNKSGFVLLGSTDGAYDVDLTKGDAKNTHWWRIGNNVPLIDSPEARKRIRKSAGCSVKELVDASSQGLMGRETYDYSDFMYCKHLGEISNNYMITLRRFPLPVDDFIGASGENSDQRKSRSTTNAACIGCMVTWMGVSGNDMSNILKYNFNMPFKEETAEFQDRQANADQNTTLLNGMFATFDKAYQKQYIEGYAGNAANTFFEHLGVKAGTLGNPPYTDYASFRDTKTKVYGPIDSIRSTYVRADSGLTFEQKITLVFEYELRSYNGINGKQAMLDLISNILNVTYTTGSFWGGGYKGFAAHQSNIFANLNIFKARGGFTNFVDAFSEDISNFGNDIKQEFGISFDSWDAIKNSGKNALKALGSILNSVGGMFLAGRLNALGRPQKTMYNALLSPAPIGFWHVTIGNPKRPIMSIGNMVITNCEIEHQGPLGLDDFPTGLKVTVQLDRGKPRDLRDIEKLYMQGNDRIYSSMGPKVFDMYKNSELYGEHKKSNTLSAYKPTTVSIEGNEDLEKAVPTISLTSHQNVLSTMKKYFGTDDAYAIYIPAAEQEFGAGNKQKEKKQKPSTQANSSLVGENKR